MWNEVLALTLQLPPLAFGPDRPPEAFAMPRALVCDVQELGRIHLPANASSPSPKRSICMPLQPKPTAYLVNQPVDILLFLSAAYAGRATWDDTPWAVRTWQATGAAAPVLIPPLPPPFLEVTRR